MDKEIVKRRTVQQARAREKRILEGIAEIGPFIRDEDWRVLGHDALEDWVRAVLTPVLHELDASLGAEIRNPIILQIDADQQAKSPLKRLGQRAIADLVGVDQKTVSNVVTSSSREEVSSHDSNVSTTDDVVDAEIIDDPALGNNLYQKVQEHKARNPMEPAQDTPESAARWIPALFESINSDVDAVDEWQEIADDVTKKRIREEIDILRDKLTKLEAKL